MNRQVLPLLISLAMTACFSAVPEAQCLRDVDCADAGVCVNTQCTGGAVGGGGGAATGGGAAAGGGAATGGGAGGGDLGGGAGGGIATGGGVGGGAGGGIGGGLGGGAGGGTAVDGGVCGCRDRLGGCQTGTSPVACGAGGSQCVACGFGEQCVNGGCVMANCGPQTCAGCCTNNFCIVPGQQTRFTCGSGGQACTQCPSGQTCQSGMCQTPVCDVTTCASGCCANGQCQSGQSRFACGIAGQVCMRCPTGQTCTSGLCLPGGVVDAGVADAGMVAVIGSPCTDTLQCQPPQNGACIPANVAGQTTGYTGGYCTSSCGAGTGPCSAGNLCVTETFFGQSQSSCRAGCSQVGQQSTCRAGYVCSPSQSSIAPGFCRPRCDVPGALSACAAGQTCNTNTGVCQ